MDDGMEFDRVELAGIAVIVAVVAVLAWFTTDTTGVGRVLTVFLAALIGGIAAVVSLYVSEW